MRGRPRKPTALRVLEGNRGKRDLPANEPIPEPPDDCPPPPPPWLTHRVARAEWVRLSRELWLLGLLTRLDVTALATYCRTYATFVEAQEEVRARGILLTLKNGSKIQNPALNIMKATARDLMKFANEFGMTPSGRSRIDISKADGNADAAGARWLNRRKA